MKELFEESKSETLVKSKRTLKASNEELDSVGKKKLELDGKTWLQNSISVWSDIRKSSEELAMSHPAMFPEMMAARLISCFSWRGDKVFDPFAGSGSTLIASKKTGRQGIGIELSKEFIKIYNNRLSVHDLFGEQEKIKEPIMINDDSNNLLKHLKKESIQLTITSPPYWDILNQKRSADSKEIRNYGNSKKDLGNISSYNEFLLALKSIFTDVYKITKPGGFCCINVMDLRKKNKFFPYHIDVTTFMNEIGFELDDIIIWDRKQEYNNLRPLGHPYVFRVNKVHEFIMIYKKNED